MPEMEQKRRSSLLSYLTTPYASSPRRWLFVAVFVTLILTLGAFGALP